MRGRALHGLVGILSLILLFLSACEVRPSTVDRWANRPGSEERFIGHLQDPKTSYEVKSRALELLAVQWQYSARMLRGGDPIREMPQADVRDQLLVELIPVLRERSQAEGIQRYHQRDIAYNMMEASDAPEVEAAYSEFLTEWMSDYWEPCVNGGAVPMRAVLDRIGAERGSALVASKLESLSFSDIGDCLRGQLRGVTWLPTNDVVAAAWTERWARGDYPEGDDITTQQIITNFFEGMDLSGKSEHMKRWLMSTLSIPGAPFGFFFEQMLTRHRDEDDVPLYVEAVREEGVYRYQALVVLGELAGADGIRRGLAALPAESDYGKWGEQSREDGLLLGAEIFCTDDKIKAMRESARAVFEAVLADGEAAIAARALSAHCLGELGNDAAAPAMRAVRSELGRNAPEVPNWSGADLGAVIDAAVAKL